MAGPPATIPARCVPGSPATASGPCRWSACCSCCCCSLPHVPCGGSLPPASCGNTALSAECPAAGRRGALPAVQPAAGSLAPAWPGCCWASCPPRGGSSSTSHPNAPCCKWGAAGGKAWVTAAGAAPVGLDKRGKCCTSAPPTAPASVGLDVPVGLDKRGRRCTSAPLTTAAAGCCARIGLPGSSTMLPLSGPCSPSSPPPSLPPQLSCCPSSGSPCMLVAAAAAAASAASPCMAACFMVQLRVLRVGRGALEPCLRGCCPASTCFGGRPRRLFPLVPAASCTPIRCPTPTCRCPASACDAA